MASSVDITLTLKDPITAKELVTLANEKLFPKDPKPVMEFYKEIYKESLNGYRYFGNLRSIVAWPPAALIGAAFTYISHNSDIKEVAYAYILPYMFGFILSLIFMVNFYFQYKQAENLQISRKSLEYWKYVANGTDLSPKTYSDIRAEVSYPWYSWLPDLSTLALLMLCITLTGLYVMVLHYPKH